MADILKLQSVQTLIKMAQAQPACTLPVETQQSYPVPVPNAKGLRVAFLYCPSQLNPQTGLRFLAPTYVAFLNAATGKLETMKAVLPSDLGQPHAPGDPIGAYNMLPDGRTPEQFYALRDRLYQAYDILMPLFAASQSAAPAETKKTAAEFKTVFPQIVEQPLLPYYYVLGKDFFAWLNKF